MGAGLYGLQRRECWDTKDNSGQECGCVQVDLHVGAQWWIGVAFTGAGLLERKGAGLQGYLGAGRCRDPGQRCRIAGVRGVRVESVRL